MFDEDEDDLFDDDGFNEFGNLDDMSMQDFLEYLYENRQEFFGDIEEIDEELRDQISEFLNKPVPNKMNDPLAHAYVKINNEKYITAVKYGKWVVFKN